MGRSLYYIAEQCNIRLDKIDMQTLIAAVVDAYGTMARNAWYENKAEGISEVDGSFIYTFPDIEPSWDASRDYYYITIPSSYLRLPHEMGINWVSFMKDRRAFVRITSISLWENLKAFALGGKQAYMVEGTKMYFPKMTGANKGNILLKMAIALDTVDARQELNIPPNMVASIIDYVVNQFAPTPQPNKKPETLR